MRLLFLSALLVLAFAAGIAVVASSREEEPAFTGVVTMLGDSLNVGVEPYLAAELEGWELRRHNREGKRTHEGLDELLALEEPLAPVLVVSLGTNDYHGDPALFRDQVEAVLGNAGRRRCVIWSTLWLDGPLDAHNEVLQDAARRHRNLELDEWSKLVGARRELLAVDRVHGSPDGYAERAERLARIIERCYPRPVEPAG